jgi:sugar lactone lactonase YvrE
MLPGGITIDRHGILYVADTNNHTIRKIIPSGYMSTIAGSPGVSGSKDGIGAEAGFSKPSGITVDATGNIYVADTGNHTIRKITSEGIVSTYAGLPGLSGISDGAGSSARFNGPVGIAFDQAGNLYVADYGNSTIRMVSPEGNVTTVVGVANQVGFQEGTLPGRLTHPVGVAVSGTSLYITLENGVVVVRNL